ncbi:MAG: hypothetical protein J0H01_27315 [Rhizobiales bacterium]|nr:hypothetical protein [Hyphomicrobiales bacterium]
MQIVGLPLLNDAIRQHREAGPMLRAFHALVAAADWSGAADLLATLPRSRQDAAGGPWRLVLDHPPLTLRWSVHFAARLVVIDAISLEIP